MDTTSENRTLGTAQRDRTLRALMPENIRVDARELQAFLSFCARSARLIRTVDSRNETSGNWADTLAKDPTVFLALLMDNQPEQWDNEFREIIREFYATTEKAGGTAVKKLVGKTLELAALLDSWYKNSISLVKWGTESPVSPVLEKAITSDLGPDLQRLKGLLQQLTSSDLLVMESNWPLELDKFHSIWSQKPADTFKDPSNEMEQQDRLKTVVEEIRQIVQRLQFTMTYLSQKAPVWFQNSLDKKSDHDPLIGLLLSFLQLFLHARDEMNVLPKKHLHHYYFDWLQQKTKPSVPDKTVVCIKLTPGSANLLLPQNTKLLAGVNDAGLESHYATLADVQLGSARIGAICNTYVSRSDMMKTGSSYKLVSGVYKSTIPVSPDGTLTPPANGINSWPVFGEEQLDKNPIDRQMTDASLGFIIAAPILLLKEGDREIDLKFYFSKSSLSILLDLIEDISRNTRQRPLDIISKLFSEGLFIQASGENGWFAVEKWKVNSPDEWIEASSLTLSLHLPHDSAAIIENDPEILGESYGTSWPLLKIVLNPDHNIFLYSFSAPLELETLEITTRVKGLRSLTLMNEIGLIDNSTPFMPFGSLPNRNSYLLIGSLELFRKRLVDLKINFEWNNLPELPGGFAEYYKEYNPDLNNRSFKVSLSALSNNSFRPLDTNQREVFQLFSDNGPTASLNPITTIENIKLNYFQINPDYQTKELPEYTNTLRSGYLKIQLTGLPMAFGHADYPRLFSQAMIELTRPNAGLMGLGGEKKSEVSLPKEPFIPIVERLSLDYTASTTINLRAHRNEENDKLANEVIIALHPFGRRDIYADGKAFHNYLFPRFESDGYFYIGLTDVSPGQAVHILFNIQESRTPVQNDFLKVEWSHLRANDWEVFSEDMLLSDKTRKFTTSGIISLLLPHETDTQTSLMPKGFYWLRASAKGNIDIIGRIKDVQINAVEVQWVDNGDAKHYEDHLVLPQIQNLLQAIPEIDSIKQPIKFYGGESAETLPGFYVRTSERLRHKNRAITIWDVERMVLDHFPKLLRVKCVGWLEYPKMKPGHIKVVVIPNATKTDLEPMIGFYELDIIQTFLQDRSSPFTNIDVINPVYEKLKVTCKIVLQKGMEHEKGKYLQLLHDDILHFICPWLQGADIVLGGDISKNDIRVFIRDRPYVRFVTRFSLVHIFQDKEKELELIDTASQTSKSEIITASTPWSILTPVSQHNIQVIVEEENIDSSLTAIEDMRLETDFIVMDDSPDPKLAAGIKLHERIEESDDDEWFLVPTSP